jgi:hypothetical protein
LVLLVERMVEKTSRYLMGVQPRASVVPVNWLSLPLTGQSLTSNQARPRRRRTVP